MTNDFEIYDPEMFFQAFVVRSYEEFCKSPVDHYCVKMAVSNADIMAERMWNWWRERDPAQISGTKSPRSYRTYLVEKECPDFQLVWDIHDGHKHVELSRPNRKVTSAAQTGIEIRGGVFQRNMFQNDAFQVGTEKFLVRLDDGTEREISEVLAKVYEMWRRLVFKSV